MVRQSRIRGLCLATVILVLVSLLTPSNANWYGKRGDKVDDSLMQILQGGFPDMVDRQLDAQVTLRKIAKVLQEYEQRQLDPLRGHDVTK